MNHPMEMPVVQQGHLHQRPRKGDSNESPDGDARLGAAGVVSTWQTLGGNAAKGYRTDHTPAGPAAP